MVSKEEKTELAALKKKNEEVKFTSKCISFS